MARIFKVPVTQFVANPSAPTVTPTGGAAGAYSYKLVATDSAGAQTAASSAGSTAVGPTTLDATHYNTVTWTDPVSTPGSILIYRTSGGATQGLIGTVAAGVQSFRDDGKVGDATSPSAANGTGVGSSIECASLRDKSVQVDGTFVSTNQIQGSIDNVNWQNEGSAATTAAVVNITTSWAFVRNKQTAYTSGTPSVTFCGHEER